MKCQSLYSRCRLLILLPPMQSVKGNCSATGFEAILTRGPKGQFVDGLVVDVFKMDPIYISRTKFTRTK